MDFSPLMLGTVQFGMNYGIANTHGKPDYELVKAILKTAVDNGITAWDTAAAYGDSEEVLGRAIKDLGIADLVTVVTKVPPVPEDADAGKFIRRSLENSLRRLQLDILPLVLLHRESDLPHLETLKSFAADGLLIHGGVSLDSLAYRDKAGAAEFLQVPCNVMDHRFDPVIADKTKKHLFIRSVYLQGMLLMDKSKIPFPEIIAYREKLEAFDMPLSELCMRYLLSMPSKVSVLTGVDTVEQLQENIRLAAKGRLPEDLMREISAAVPLLDEQIIRPCNWKR